MDQEKFRHEIKHFINVSDYFVLRSRLKLIMYPDPFAGDDGKYKVRSLYFDNFNDKALLEKIDGVNNREKFRIRYYKDDPSFIKLEKKCKINGLCTKQSMTISREDCQKLLLGDTEWMLKSKDVLALGFNLRMSSELLKPKTIVDYIREAYIYKPGNVRITMDSNIKSGIFSKDFLNPELPTINAYPGGQIILEVKFDSFLPDIISDIIQTNQRQSTAVSKYAACRIYG